MTSAFVSLALGLWCLGWSYKASALEESFWPGFFACCAVFNLIMFGFEFALVGFPDEYLNPEGLRIIEGMR